MTIRVAVPREVTDGENRVALTPEIIARLAESGIEVTVQSGAGVSARFTDESYRNAGASIAPDAETAMRDAAVVLKVQEPTQREIGLLPSGSVLIALLQPLTSFETVTQLAERGVTAFGMELVPRTARAQKMDALSSMASIAGYRAALLAAESTGKYFPMMITAAGTYAPCKGLVLGAGVAGLQAIATAKRLGAVMSAYDVRPAVKEQVESLGATFLVSEAQAQGAEQAGGYAKELAEDVQKRERDLLHKHITGMDFVITTAAIPGRRAPVLITADMVADMRPGSVIVDLAAETGGNCALTVPGESREVDGVVIIGPLNLPSGMPIHASQMYSRNVSNLLLHIIADGEIRLDFDDDIIKGCCVTHDGKIVNEQVRGLIEQSKVNA
jgi:NAD(P) transhydrogenase subunit alpha